MASNPEFSVLVPTRNRYASASLAIQTILAGVGEDTEVIVGDNGDKPLALPYSDSRLKILRAPSVLSMPDNWERVLRAARGEWLFLMSDKCRLVPGILAVLRGLAGSRYTAVAYERTLFFQDLTTDNFENVALLEESPGQLTRSGRPVVMEERSSKAELRNWFEKVDYTAQRPMLYNALIHRTIVDRVVDRGEAFFVGMAPDVASGLRILSETEEFLYTTLPGTMIHFPSRATQEWSTGFSLAWGTARGKSFIAEFRGNPFSSDSLPPIGTAVVLQTLLDFVRLGGDSLPKDLAIGWREFARSAAHEIERFPKAERSRLQLTLLNALLRGDHGLGAAVIQLKSIIVSRMPKLYEQYRYLRARGTTAEAPTVTTPGTIETDCSSMRGAVARLGDELSGWSSGAPIQ